ncbi:hypothetical protein [Halochromatium salexigens]|uniref:hypothetical protein n=1 Tax=Halochromatium salexigens TaxID=49447 RepID=UPI001912708B|nr:hypothetical protein [Halochromatium salexigens]
MKRLLFAIALLLLGGLLLQWLDWREPLPSSAEEAGLNDLVSAPVAPDPNQAAPMLRPEDDYFAVMERPLFLPDRRPPDDEPVEANTDDLSEEVAELEKLDVNATLILSPSEASVWLKDPAREDLVRLRLGEEYQGWTVAQIKADHVLMERQGTTETLNLMDYSAPTSPPSWPRPPANQRSRVPSRNRSPSAADPTPVSR